MDVSVKREADTVTIELPYTFYRSWGIDQSESQRLISFMDTYFKILMPSHFQDATVRVDQCKPFWSPLTGMGDVYVFDLQCRVEIVEENTPVDLEKLRDNLKNDIPKIRDFLVPFMWCSFE